MRTISVKAEDPPDDTEFATLDEAIAYALHDAPDGCVIAIHEEGCEIDDDEDECTCTPLELTTGAKS